MTTVRMYDEPTDRHDVVELHPREHVGRDLRQ
jgi:hypothetical protein